MSKTNKFQYFNDTQRGNVTVLDATMSDFSYIRHAHEEYSLGVTLKGRQDFFCRNGFHKSPAGGVLVFNPEDVHDGHSGISESLEYVMIYVHPDELMPLFQALGCTQQSIVRVNTPLMNDALLRHQILSFRNILDNPTHTKIDYEFSLFQLAQSLAKHAGRADDCSRSVTSRDRLLTQAKDFILANTTQDISIDDIAAVANMSKYHFIRSFRRQFGITPHKYVLNSRIIAARKAIEAGAPASETAQVYGFADNSHFNRCFKPIFGMTPKQYQRQLN